MTSSLSDHSFGPARVVVMGVSGCGKSTVGELLAATLGIDFLDGDSLHPTANVAKMHAGHPLDDADRLPWLEAVGQALAADPNGMVIACSALKRSYRDLIRAEAPGTVFVHLAGSREILDERVNSRPGHFMPASLLDSQLATLEPLGADEAGVVLDIVNPALVLVSQATAWLGTERPHLGEATKAAGN